MKKMFNALIYSNILSSGLGIGVFNTEEEAKEACFKAMRIYEKAVNWEVLEVNIPVGVSL